MVNFPLLNLRVKHELVRVPKSYIPKSPIFQFFFFFYIAIYFLNRVLPMVVVSLIHSQPLNRLDQNDCIICLYFTVSTLLSTTAPLKEDRGPDLKL